MKKILIPLCLMFVALLMLNCSGQKYSLAPIKTSDPDRMDIPRPDQKEENQYWDLADYTFFYQVEKVLDLGWTAKKIGKGLNIANGKPADNLNVLDEVPNSSWYTNRHYHNRMSIEELKRGPDVTDGPDYNTPWLITSGKFEGGTPGFTIKDGKGDYYIIKFDAPTFQEMGSSAEVISTKILYACGYFVPQNTIEYFDPTTLKIGKTVKFEENGQKRQMRQSDLVTMLKDIPRRDDGKIRALASKYVNGRPVGVWNYRGTRNDDLNDRVAHEHRRELRGLRSISSWLSDADRRAANTLAVYTTDPENGNKYIQHYLLDMGSTLGSNNIFPHAPKYGNEYLIDPRTIGLQFITLGTWVKPWEFDVRNLDPEFPSVGYYESEIFNPAEWYPTYPNPAFEYATFRDAFWGAKIVMSFTDEEIRAIVEEAQMSDPRAQEYLIKTLIERRDKIGQYWFSKMNPVDKFRFEKNGEELNLVFNDLAVDGNLERAADSKYLFTLSYKDRGLHQQRVVEKSVLLISKNGNGFLDEILQANKYDREEEKIFSIALQTQRKGKKLSKVVEVYFYYPGFQNEPRVVGVKRHE